MYWLEPTLLTFIFLVNSVRVLVFNYVALVDSDAPVSTMQRFVFIPQFNLSGTTDRARSRARLFVMLAKLVVHLLGKER